MGVTRLLCSSLRVATASVLLLTVSGALTSCGGDSDSSTATWGIDRDEQVSSGTTEFKVTVTCLGCSSGVEGQPQAPKIEYTESEVRIVFRMSPRIDDGNCVGTLGVPYDVELSEPLGDRSLVDGECDPDSDARATSFCLREGVRYAPG